MRSVISEPVVSASQVMKGDDLLMVMQKQGTMPHWEPAWAHTPSGGTAAAGDARHLLAAVTAGAQQGKRLSSAGSAPRATAKDARGST